MDGSMYEIIQAASERCKKRDEEAEKKERYKEKDSKDIANNLVNKVDCCDCCFEELRFEEDKWQKPVARMRINNKGISLCKEHLERLRDNIADFLQELEQKENHEPLNKNREEISYDFGRD